MHVELSKNAKAELADGFRELLADAIARLRANGRENALERVCPGINVGWSTCAHGSFFRLWRRTAIGYEFHGDSSSGIDEGAAQIALELRARPYRREYLLAAKVEGERVHTGTHALTALGTVIAELQKEHGSSLEFRISSGY